MSKQVVLKTDASYKKDIGCGLSFEFEVKDEGGVNHIDGNKFVETVDNSTHGELIATVYGLIKVIKQINKPEEYMITVASDCQYVVESFQQRYPDQSKLVRTALNILDSFAGWSVRWISRVKNTKADALAKSALMKGEDGIW